MGGKWDPASAIVNDVRAMFTENDRLFRDYGLGDTYDSLNNLADGIEERQVPQGVASYMALAYRDWAPMAFWNRYKEVYTMHPGLTAELGDTHLDDTIPGKTLQHLPHPDPLFVFPGGIDVTLNDGKPGRLVAIQVSGAVVTAPGRAVITSTTDQAADGLYLSVVTEVLGETGAVEDWDWCHTSIPITDSFTIASLINTDREYFSFDGRSGFSEGIADNVLGYVQRVTAIALSHLLYAVSRGAEVAPPRKTTTAQGAKGKQSGAPVPRPIKHRPVGYVIGAALDAARRQAERTGPATTADGSRTVRPHMRRAHFHTVRFGKGRANSYVEWFPPIPVKVDGTAAEPTIHAY